MRRVVVGVEDLPHSEVPLEWAARAAEQRGAVLRLVHATGFPVLAIDVLAVDSVLAGARALLDRAAAHVHDVVPDVEVETVLDRRRPAEALVDLSATAELLVTGTHRLTATERLLSGSLAYQIASAAHCPVAVVPGPVGPEATGVVVGVDGSADAVAAVALAAAEADRTGEPLTVVHAWTEPVIFAPADEVIDVVATSAREEEDVVLGESVAGLAEAYPDLVVHPRLVHEQPATALLAAADGARLLVVGSRGRHGLTRVLLGSVSHTVLLHAAGPVLVARTPHIPRKHS